MELVEIRRLIQSNKRSIQSAKETHGVDALLSRKIPRVASKVQAECRRLRVGSLSDSSSFSTLWSFKVGRLIETTGRLWRRVERIRERRPFPKVVNERLETNVSLDAHPLNEPWLQARSFISSSIPPASSVFATSRSLAAILPRAICIFGVVNTSVAYRDRLLASTAAATAARVFQAPYINPLFNTPLSVRPAGKRGQGERNEEQKRERSTVVNRNYEAARLRICRAGSKRSRERAGWRAPASATWTSWTTVANYTAFLPHPLGNMYIYPVRVSASSSCEKDQISWNVRVFRAVSFCFTLFYRFLHLSALYRTTALERHKRSLIFQVF